MDQLKAFFESCERVGIQDEYVFLSIFILILSYLIWKQTKIFKSYHIMIAATMKSIEGVSESINKNLKSLVSEHTKSDEQMQYLERTVNAQFTQQEVWRESVKEKLDGLEDHMKEIKKHLFFTTKP